MTRPVDAAHTAGRLSRLLSELSCSDCEEQALQRAVELTMRAAGAQRCALMTATGVALERGFGAGAGSTVPLAELMAARGDGAPRALLGDWGAHELYFAEVEHEPVTWLVACRASGPFTAAERDRVTAIAGVLSMTLALLHSRAAEAQQLRAAERELAHQALHDRLTGLANRDLLHDRATRLLARAAGYDDRLMTAMIIDLDDFQALNDSLDRIRGDQLLVQVAQRLTDVVAKLESATRSLALGRYGSDEFLLLGERLTGEEDVTAIAERLRAALTEPFVVSGQKVSVTASIGIACTGAERVATQRMDADQFMSDAEVALGRAKELGGDRFEIFEERMRARLMDRALLETELRAGLERGELALLYQPVVTVADAELVAVEALVRWQHPQRGLLDPGEFIPLAERSDLIVDLGAWVLEEACAQIARWRDAHPARLNVRVSLNVSARQLSPQLIDTVAATLERHHVDPSQLALEITESLLMQRAGDSRELLSALKRTGVSIVLDDFGTGFSSLSYLKELPLDQLKLDRSFCTELEQDLRSAKIVAATIEMARALGMTIVAEGVETADQLTILNRLGCDFAQGFWFAQPEPADAVFRRVLAAYESDSRLVADGVTEPVRVRTSAGVGVVDRRRGGDRRDGVPGRRVQDRRTPAPRAVDPDPRAEADRRPELARLAAEALPVGPVAPDAVRASHLRSLGRMTGLLYLFGSVLALPGDVVMHAPSVLTVILLTLMGLLTGIVCLTMPWQRLSERWLHAAAVLGTIEVTISAVAIGRHATVLGAFYAMIAAAVAYGFRDRRVIAVQTAMILTGMALPPLLLADQPTDAVPRMLVTALVTCAIVTVVVYLRERLEASAARQRALADRDPLTEVGNYRVLHERLAHELAAHRRDGQTLSVLLVDLDDFKQVNEHLGHAAGDDVLRRVARTLRDAARERDTVARQGGDEFAVLAPDTDADGAELLAARLRQRLRRLQFAGGRGRRDDRLGRVPLPRRDPAGAARARRRPAARGQAQRRARRAAVPLTV